jgi:hypothetical protein
VCSEQPHTQAPRGYIVPPCTVEDLRRLTPEMFEEALKQWEVPCNKPAMKEQVLQALPSLSEACRLSDIFLEHGQYLYVCSYYMRYLIDMFGVDGSQYHAYSCMMRY